MAEARVYARMCGFIYVLIFLASSIVFFAAGRLVVEGDAVKTASNILAFEQLWRAGFSAEIFTMLCDVAVAWLLYVLLAPVNQSYALLAAFFRLTYVAVYAQAVLANVVVLPLLHQHLREAAMLAVRIHGPAFALSLVFFGANLALAGYLIGRAPVGVRWLSVALELAGAAYILNSFAIFIAPPVHAVIYPWILLPPFVGELSLTFWLLFTPRFNAIPRYGRAGAT